MQLRQYGYEGAYPLPASYPPVRSVLSLIRRVHELHPQEENATVPVSQKARKVRKDKGTIAMTPRDIAALRWIGDQTVIRADQLQLLLGRQAQRETKQEGIIAEGTVDRILTRWTKAKWVETKRYFTDEPEYVWLTAHGQEEVGLPYKKPFSGKRTYLKHYFYVNQARLHVETKFGDEARWESERRLRLAHIQILGHYPDGRVHLPDGMVAVEVELTDKGEKRILEILTSLAQEYPNITYFVSSETRSTVQKRVASLPADLQESYEIINLEEL